MFARPGIAAVASRLARCAGQGVRRFLLIVIAVVLVAAIGGAGWFYLASDAILDNIYPLPPSSFHAAHGLAAEKEGHRLVTVFGCNACHNPDLRGGYDSYAHTEAANLTKLAPTFSDADFDRAVRHGLAPDGTSIASVMPSDSFQHLTDTQLAAIVAYIRGVPPGGDMQPRAFHDIPGRWLALRGVYHPVQERMREPGALDLGPRTPQGRQIASALCSVCHGPDLKGQEGSPDLALVAAYDFTDFKTLLRTGKAAGNREAGEMSQVARGNLKYLTDAEISALYEYLAARGRKLTGSPG